MLESVSGQEEFGWNRVGLDACSTIRLDEGLDDGDDIFREGERAVFVQLEGAVIQHLLGKGGRVHARVQFRGEERRVSGNLSIGTAAGVLLLGKGVRGQPHAGERFMEMGYENVRVFIDGYPAWEERGYPIE